LLLTPLDIADHNAWQHDSLEKNAPRRRAVEGRPDGGDVIASDRVGGLHHRCTWRRAA
jgi:hypothetical protein